MIAALVPTLALTFPPPAAECSLADLDRFPSRELAEEYCAFAEQYRQFLENSYPLSPRFLPGYYAAQREAERLREPWSVLLLAQGCVDPKNGWSLGDEGRLAYLERLRVLLGDEAYFAVAMPPPVPVWRFRELR